MTVVFEAPDGDVLCESCVDDIDVVKWQRDEYCKTDSLPGEFCSACGDSFTETAI